MFRSARIKLTGWYLLMIMAVSLFFSVVIYANVDRELTRLEQIQEISRTRAEEYFGYAPPARVTTIIEENLINEARERLISDLAVLNAFILLAAGWVGYFLAGRTLRPIREMIDTQSRFLTDASHELKTPLTSLRAEIEIFLRSKRKKQSLSEEILRSNLEEVIRLQKLTDNLMELATLEKIGEKIPFEKVDLLEIILLVIKNLEKTSKEKKVEIISKVKKTKIRGHKESLEELFTILIDNAIKYSKSNSKVIISSGKLNNFSFIKVEDTGIGISKEDLDHIFERFFRADRSRNASNVSGYGLGLSIAKEIVAIHKGQIKVKSSKKGSTFTVELPLA